MSAAEPIAAARETLLSTVRGLGAVAWRIVQSLPIVFGVTLLTFLLIHFIPGDPARTILGSHATPKAITALRSQWGLNESLPAQYWTYLVKLLHGNLGESLFYQESSTKIIASFAAPTIWLIIYSALLSIIISVPVAIAAAVWKNRLFDHLARIASQIGLGMPQPWVGLLLLLGLALRIRVFPASGFGSDTIGHIRAMFLPSLTIALSMAPILIRSLREELIDTLRSDYITTARSKGIRERRVMLTHALRNASIAAITILGLNVAWLVSGTVVVETVFSLPGLGALLVTSILRRDFPVVQGLALVFALMVIVINIVTDLARSLLDPRVLLR